MVMEDASENFPLDQGPYRFLQVRLQAQAKTKENARSRAAATTEIGGHRTVYASHLPMNLVCSEDLLPAKSPELGSGLIRAMLSDLAVNPKPYTALRP